MKGRFFGLLIVLGVPLAASAQVTTLDYQGSVMGGTSTTYIYPAPLPPFGTPVSQIESAPISTNASFDATITYSGSLAQNNLVIDSYEVNLTANNGQNFELQNIGLGINSSFTMNGTTSCGLFRGGGTYSCISLTTSGDSITGATINLQNSVAQTDNFDLSIGPSGDAFTYSQYGIGLGGVNCTNGVSGMAGTFVGPAGAYPCSMNIGSSTAGVWALAPEIDPTSAAGGLTLLLGSLLVLRARRAQCTDG
jgi:hypothetical protein